MKLCIVKLSAMGDIIHAMVALEFIKKKHPNIEIDWIVEKTFMGILEHNPNINNILPLELKKIKKDKKEFFTQLKLIQHYKKRNYDVIIDAQGLLKSAIVSKLLKSSHSILYGFSKNSIREGIASVFYDKKIEIAYNENTIDRNVKVLTQPFHINVTSQDILNKKPFLFYPKNIPFQKEKYNLFVIGSTWESRNYPKEKFLQIAEELQETTYIIWGSTQEKEKALWLEKHSKFISILPKGNLNQLKSIIAHSNLLIGNDTGPTHIAWGLNTPSVTLFGPTPTNRVYITPINKVVKSKSIINHYKLNKNDFSICEIEIKEILQAIDEIFLNKTK